MQTVHSVRIDAQSKLATAPSTASLDPAQDKANEMGWCFSRSVSPPTVAAKLIERLPSEELTPRESNVLQLVAAGKTNRLIGANLAISEGTVKSHVQSLFRKLNVLSRTEAIAVANRRGLLHM